MPRSERVGETDACSISRRWLLDPNLAAILLAMESEITRDFSTAGIPWGGLFIISAFRTASHQFEHNPLNPSSKHTRCPSMAVDLRVADLPATTTPDNVWRYIGHIAKSFGLQWGGDFQTPDNNHFQLPG